MLFASTVINYVDRQTLSLLAPYLKHDYQWTNTDYANVVVGFRAAYAVGQTVCGRFIDRVGTRRGLTVTVFSYSVVSVLTSLAAGLKSFAVFRTLLGFAESANWPGAAEAVSQWFPARERALASALFDSGSSIGGAIAPWIVLSIYFRWGWRASFVLPGLLGFVWLILWRRFYYSPPAHPHISGSELELLSKENQLANQDKSSRLSWVDLLKLPQTWGTIASKAFTDPVFFFIADWFPIYLVSKGITLTNALIAVWIPFLATDAGNFFAGAASGYLIKRGWTLGAARKLFVVVGGAGVMLIIPSVFTVKVSVITVLFAAATFSYGCFTTIANVLPSDLYKRGSVASVSGLSGTGAALGTIVAFELIGRLSDARQATASHAFDPIVIAAGLLPTVGAILVLALVRNTRATEEGWVRRI